MDASEVRSFTLAK